METEKEYLFFNIWSQKSGRKETTIAMFHILKKEKEV